MDYDVIVVGAGSAGMEAAVAAAAHGAGRVLVLEKAPREEAGGNARLSHTGFRFPVSGREEVRQFLTEPDPDLDRLVVEPYTAAELLADVERLSEGGADPVMARTLAEKANESVHWMRRAGVRWTLNRPRPGPDGLLHVEKGMALQAGTGSGGGRSQLEDWARIATGLGVEVRHEAAVVGLERGSAADPRLAVLVGDAVHPGGAQRLRAGGVVLAAGGFQASPQRRARHLGPAFADVVVRGSRHDTGEVLEAALALGAARAGEWTGANLTPVDAVAGTVEAGNDANRYSYPYGITVNLRGERFFDEGEASHSYTYARCGWHLVAQPEGRGYQIFDATTYPLLKHYAYRYAHPVVADDVAELGRLLGLPAGALEHTVTQFNAAVDETVPFDPTCEDGRGTVGLAVPKSNWATRLQTPPFTAFPVTAGITFTYGGLRVDADARVLDEDGVPIDGLYASGDILGIFARNYPSGSGQTRNVVFSLAAGRHLARRRAAGGGHGARREPAPTDTAPNGGDHA